MRFWPFTAKPINAMSPFGSMFILVECSNAESERGRYKSIRGAPEEFCVFAILDLRFAICDSRCSCGNRKSKLFQEPPLLSADVGEVCPQSQIANTEYAIRDTHHRSPFATRLEIQTLANGFRQEGWWIRFLQKPRVAQAEVAARSEERRVGKECFVPC